MTKEKFLGVSIFIYIIAGSILLLGKKEWFPDFYNPVYMGVLAFGSAFIIFLPKFLFSAPDGKKRKILLQLQTIIAVSLLLSGAGGLGLFKLYKIGFEYDKLVHFVVPFLFTMTLTDFISQWYTFSIRKALFLSIILVSVGGLAWEFWEVLSDWSFGTQTLGFYGKQITKDTIVDILMNALGMIAGTIVIIKRILGS